MTVSSREEQPAQPAATPLAPPLLFASHFLPFLLSLAIIGPFCFRLIPESDLGWHMALGRVVARSGIPSTNALCWTAFDSPWSATSWLFDWVAYELASHVGLLGVQLLMLALIAVTLAGVLAAGLKLDARYGGWSAPVLALLLIPRISERPFVATWAVLAWVLALCLPSPGAEQSPAGATTFRRRLWCLPLIALATNLHQGAIFSAIILFLFCAEAYVFGGRRPRELVLAVGAGLALAATPGGFSIVLDTLSHVHVGEAVHIMEYRAPTLKFDTLFFVTAAAALPLAWLVRRRSPAFSVALMVFACFGCWAIRFIYDFDVILAPALAVGFTAFGRRSRPPFVIAGLLLTLLAVEAPMAQSLALLGPRWNAWGVPVRAGEFVRAEHLDGRMYNGYWEGGYLEWALPELRWFQDARPHAFPLEFFQEENASEGTPAGFQAFLRRHDVEWAITGLGDFLDGKHELHAPGWALVYWDDVNEVFVRRDVARFAPLIQRLEYRHFRDDIPVVKDIAAAPRAELPEWLAELDRYESTTPGRPEVVLARCALAARRGQPASACDVAQAQGAGANWLKNVAAARAIPPAP